MRYLFISRYLKGGGAERFVSVFTSYMADKGYDTHLVLYEKTENDYAISNNVKIHMMPERENNVFGKLARVRDMNEIIRKVRPDVVIPFLDMVIITSFICTRFKDIKYVYTVRVSPWHEAGSTLKRRIRRFIARQADFLMLQNEEQGEYFEAVSNGKKFVIPNPVDKQFVQQEKDLYREEISVISCFGRLCSQKNYDLLIDACSELEKELSGVCVNIYGEGDYYERLKAKIEKLKMESTIKVCGRNNEVVDTLSNTDLFVMTSNYEGMPNALLEAMAVGVPCISSDCSTGPRDMIEDGKTGLLYRTGDKEEFKRKLLWAIDNPEKMNEMGRQARRTVLEKYTLENSLERFLEMCDI